MRSNPPKAESQGPRGREKNGTHVFISKAARNLDMPSAAPSQEAFVKFLKAKWKEMKAKGAPALEIHAAKKLYKSAKKKGEGGEGSKDTVVESDEEQKAEKKKSKKSKKEDKKEKKGSKKDDNGTKKRKRSAEAEEEEESDSETNVLSNIKIDGGGVGYTVPAPFTDFESTTFHPSLKAALVQSGFTAPTPVQAQTWPITLAGNDLVSVAKTGSGKTCGYLLPVLHLIHASGSSEKPYLPSPLALVLAPTRELTMQIQEQALKFGKCLDLKSVCIYGGVPKHNQVNSLRGGANAFPHLVVGTPGRLLDLSKTNKALSLDKIKLIVLDEADRMLDMGFEPQLEKIAQCIKEGQMKTNTHMNVKLGNCQALFFSATWPAHVQKVATLFLRPDRVSVIVGGAEGEKLVAHEGITQDIRVVRSDDEKPGLLRKTIQSLHTKGAKGGSSAEEESEDEQPKAQSISIRKTIVFCARKQSCDELEQEYYQKGYRCASLHSGKEQRERSAVMNAFATKGELDKMTPQQLQKLKKRNKAGVMDGYDYGAEGIELLFATDVAARGLDIADITTVINFDFPQQQGQGGVEEYVHRIGRTGRRAGAEALSVTFFTEEKDHESAGDLLKILENANQEVPPKLLKLTQGSGGGGGGGGGWGGGEWDGSAAADDVLAKQAKRAAKKEKKQRAKEIRGDDWTCMSCGASVFAAKDTCFKCGKPKP
jgi:ATP-dependent RNA helicase DDX5/DBP2